MGNAGLLLGAVRPQSENNVTTSRLTSINPEITRSQQWVAHSNAELPRLNMRCRSGGPNPAKLAAILRDGVAGRPSRHVNYANCSYTSNGS
jgi:hypothetical protein